MPKKKRTRVRRASPQPDRPVRATVDREPGMADRLKKNPLSVILGLIVVLSMVLALGAEIVQSSKPQTLPPTPTPFAQANPTAAPQAAAKKTYASAPAMTIDKSKSYTATIATAKGDIKLQLFADVAPVTVNNFVFLAREGFYDGLKIMRADEGWLIQTGDPSGNMTGGPGYSIPYEASGKTHVVGAVGMAHSASPDSAGSQFYIVKTAQPSLDPPNQKFCVFAQTIAGMDVLNQLTNNDVMLKVTIEEK